MHSRNLVDWFLAFFNVFVVWSAGSILASYSSQVLQINPVVYVCTMFLSCSSALLLYAGPGKNSLNVLRSAQTWGYGIALIFGFIIGFGLFSQVTPVEGELLQMFTAIVSVFIGWLFYNRVPNKLQLVGLGFILSGIVWVCKNLPLDKIAVVVFLFLTLAIFQCLRSFIGESHKQFNYVLKYSQTPIRDQLRVIGYIMFTLSMLFLLVTLPLAYVQSFSGVRIHHTIPVLSDFLYFKGIFVATLVGVLVILPARFLEFNSLVKLKTENYLALGAVGPFATMFWQRATQSFTGLDLKEFTVDDVIAACLITAGGLIIVVSKILFKIKDKDLLNEYVDFISEDEESKHESHDIILNTLKFYNSNKKKVSEKLKLPIVVINDILQNNRALYARYLKEITRIYKNDILTKDSLTKINNRLSLDKDLIRLDRESYDYSIIYMDLNKFKEINDTFGHEFGDQALKVVADRIAKFEDKNTKAYRLGGDEFVIIAKRVKSKELYSLVDSLKQEIIHPFLLDKIDVVVNVGVSIGIAISIEHKEKRASELLSIADSGMYEQKHAR